MVGLSFALGLALSGCQSGKAPAAKGPAMQAMPVKTMDVSLAPVAQSSEYVATVMSRRSATLQPQAAGRLIAIRTRSGDRVKAGQILMQIDAQPQIASVEAQRATERQKKSVYDYNATEVERQHKLFDAGVTSREVWDQAQQSYNNAKADYESAVALRKTQEEQLAYYTVRAPFDGIVGDVPVHVGDYVTQSTLLTTLDENKDLEAYIYLPTEHSTEARLGLGVELYDTGGKLLEKSKVDFVSPQVDATQQGILVKAPIHASSEMVRHAQLIKAHVIWETKPMAMVPVLAVMRQGSQTFVFVVRGQGGQFAVAQTAVTLGDTVGNQYSVVSGLNAGDKVVVSSTQFLVNGMPVIPMGS